MAHRYGPSGRLCPKRQLRTEPRPRREGTPSSFGLAPGPLPHSRDPSCPPGLPVTQRSPEAHPRGLEGTHLLSNSL